MITTQMNRDEKGRFINNKGILKKHNIKNVQEKSNEIFHYKYKVIKIFIDEVGTKALFYCNEHKTETSQLIDNHIRKAYIPCKECSLALRREKNKTGKIIEYQSRIDSNNEFKGKYFIYDLVYKEDKAFVKTECIKHGRLENNIFWTNTLSKSRPCKECSKVHLNKRLPESVIFQKIENIIKDRYSYHGIERSEGAIFVKLKCKIHLYNEAFKVRYTNIKINTKHHCVECTNEKKRKLYKKYTTEEFIKKGSLIHEDLYLYNYEEIEKRFKNVNSKIPVICKKHGEFLITYNTHIIQEKGFCPRCCFNSEVEYRIERILLKRKIKYIHDKPIFEDLLYKKRLRPDFFLPEYNLILEYDGEHHFSIKLNQNTSNLLEKAKKDFLKNRYAKKNNFNILRITYKNIKQIEYLIDENLAKIKEGKRVEKISHLYSIIKKRLKFLTFIKSVRRDKEAT